MRQGTDLSSGNVGRLMAKLAVPSIAAQIVNMLYNIVDRIYIGHIPESGSAALTGVGVCFPILMLISAFGALVGMGGAPRAAIAMGKNDNESAQKILGNCMTMVVVFAVLLTAVFLIFGEPLLRLFGASDQTLPYALSYQQIYVCGSLFVMISMGLNSFISTQGFALTSMMTTLIGAVINIVLDPILIFGFHMGVQGAAVATVLSQAVSAFWVIRFLTGKRTILRIQKKNLRLRRPVIFPVLALGVSPFIMQSTESLLNICFNSSLQRYGGDTAVGAMTILSSLMQVISLPLMGLSQGAQPIISFNYGAKKYDRVKKAVKLLILCGGCFAGVFWLLIQIWPELFVRIFSSDETLIGITAWAARIYLGAVVAMGFQMACQQCFIALGEAKISLFLALERKILLLIPLIFILPNFIADQVFAVFLAEPIADVLATATTVAMFIFRFKKLMRGAESAPVMEAGNTR